VLILVMLGIRVRVQEIVTDERIMLKQIIR